MAMAFSTEIYFFIFAINNIYIRFIIKQYCATKPQLNKTSL